MKKIFIIVSVLLSITCNSIGGENPQSIGVSISDLRKDFSKYHGKLVRVSGLWYRDFETSWLLNCDIGEDYPIHINISDQFLVNSKTYKRYARLSKFLIKKQLGIPKTGGSRSNWIIQANVELEGYFEVAERKLNPPEISNDGENSILPGFGHLFGVDFQIRVIRLIKYNFIEENSQPVAGGDATRWRS